MRRQIQEWRKARTGPALGEVLYNDDITVMRILGKAPLERKATYTTSILSRSVDHRIALFITGHHHAGS